MKKYYVKHFGIMFFAFIFAFLLAGIFIPSVNEAFAVDEGLNFISNCPTETTEYKQGEGIVTFVPATAEKRASIILENATIYANKKVSY